jgi:hypothetical protein
MGRLGLLCCCIFLAAANCPAQTGPKAVPCTNATATCTEWIGLAGKSPRLLSWRPVGWSRNRSIYM